MEKENFSSEKIKTNNAANAEQHEQHEQHATQTCLKEQDEKKTCSSDTAAASTTTPLSSSLSRIIMTSNQETDIIKKVAMSEEIPTSNSSLTTSNTFTTSTTSCITASTTTTTTSFTVTSALISATSTPTAAAPPTKIYTTTTATTTATAIPQVLVISSQSIENDTNGIASATAADADQFVTPQKSTFTMPNKQASTSLKKKRNKSSKCLQLNVSSSSCSSSSNNNHTVAAATHEAQNVGGSSNVGNIKTSLSMTSLPPNEKQDGNDKIKAKLNMERPYNSLKKNTDRNLTNQLATMHASYSTNSNNNSNKKLHRYSWGSGHSSSSLHSSAATLGIGSGKDDFWAAIQTNYNYIMDTNLLDTCKEARCEIEGASCGVLDNKMDKCFKMLDDHHRAEGSCEDPKELRKWLREMEHKLENAPTLSEATMLTCAELEKYLNEHSVLYHEIVSHARVVSACIRVATEKEQQLKLQQQQLLEQQQQQQQQLQQQLELNNEDFLNQNNSSSCTTLSIQETLLNLAEQNTSSLSSTDETIATTTTTNTEPAETTDNSASLPTTSSSSGIVCSTESKSKSSLNLATSPSNSCTTQASSSSRKSENNLERLQNRYHLLYLKAFEVQLWLDGLLRKKSSSVGNLTNEDLDSEYIDDSHDLSSDDDDDDDDIDDIDEIDNVDNSNDIHGEGATEDDLNDVASDLESDITNNSVSSSAFGNDDDDNNPATKQPQKQQHHHQLSDILHIDIDDHQQQQQSVNVSSSSSTTAAANLQQHQQQKPAHIQAAAANSARDCIQTKIDCEDGDDEQEDYENYEEDNDYDDDDDEEALENYSEDVIDSSPNYRKQLGYTKLLVTFDRRRLSHTPHANAARELTLTDFEADSESSDLEIIQKQQQRYKASCLQQLPYGLLRNSKYHSYSNLNSKNNYRQLSKTTTTALKAFIIDNTTAGCSNTTTDLDCGRLNQAKTAAASLGGSICDMQTVANALVNGQQNQYSLNCAALVQPNDAMTAGSPTNLASSSSITAAARATAASATDLHIHSGDSSSGGSSSSNSSRSITGNSSSNSNSTSNFNSMETTVNIGNSHSFNSHIMLEKLTANENNHLHQQQQQHQQHLLNAANNGKAVAAGVAGTAAGGGGAMKHKNIAIISPNNRNNSNNGVGAGKHHHHHHHQQPNKSSSLPSHKSPTVLRKHHGEHFSITDVSKFNRSNRKSKHCATFYFKHLDTDNETNYSTSNCGGECCSGTNEDDDYNLNNSKTGNRTLTDVRRSGIMSSSADSSDLLKSAEVSSDDEGWLYTSSTTTAAISPPPPHNHRQQHLSIGGGIESLNSNHNFRQQTISSNEIHFIAQQSEATAAIQSPTVSSSTPASTLQQAVAVSASAISAIIGDDSDKENKEAKATTTTTVGTAAAATSSIRINLSQATQYVASTTVIGSNSSAGGIVATSRIAAANGGSSSSSSITSSSYSSNELMTEATATTSESAKTQILNNSHHQQQQQQQHSMNRSYRSEMELQINGNKKLHSHSGSSNNNNCANSAQQQKLIMSSNQYSSSMQLDSPTQSSAPYNGLEDANGNLEKENINFYTRADIRNISVKPNDNLHYQQKQQQHNAVVSISPASMMYAQQLHVGNVGKRLPPRSPAKSIISHCSTTTSSSTISPSKGKVSHESIKQLVLEAENLVRDEALKTPSKQQKHSKGGGSSNTLALNSHSGGGVNCGNIVQISATIKKREIAMPGPIKERVQEWLEHQPTTPVLMQRSISHNAHHHHHQHQHQHQHQHHNNHHHANQSDLPLSPINNAIPPVPIRADDCEASGEASETDSVPQHCSDTSEGLTDSIATCMQTSTNSYGNSTERMGGSAEPIATKGNSNQSLNVKVVRRQQSRRKSERPWSVSCLSQLTTDVQQKSTKVTNIADVQAGLASHSISESALDSLSPGRPRASSSSAATQVKSYDSKGSLKRRKTRKKKLSYSNVVANGKKSDSNSEDYQQQQQQHHAAATAQDMANKVNYTQSVLLQSYDNMTPQQIQEITQALMQLQNAEQQQIVGAAGAEHTGSTDENSHLMKPNFRVGAFTTAYMASETKLGSLAALATYMNEDGEQQGEYTTGTEDHHSSFSETAWDNYQEKYNSENYSEGFDSDAARKLLEFGDDYRNFIDSQSDCCSSLSAANNLDSFSPPRMDSLQQNEAKIITQDTIVSSVDHARRRRALELEYERRRKNLEIRRKSCQESLEYHNPNKSPAVQALSASTQALTPKNSQTERFNFQNKLENNTASNIHRKLEFGIGMSHSAQSLRRTSESDTSQRRRKADERRRSSRNLEKCIKLIPATTSSSSENDSDGEREIRNLLQQSHNRLEDTKALKIRCHLLRPEDYTEIINTCRDNIRCLESVLKGPSSSVLSSQCISQSKDLLSAWEDLLGWSENAAAARKMQEEMILLKHSLNRLGNKSSFELLDTEPSIQIAIEALKNEKTQLQTYRTSMLKLNASVHSWLTRQERRLQNALVEQQLKAAAVNLSQELLEEKEETESEQQTAQQTEAAASTTKQTTMITVTDSNGNQVETHTATTTSTSSVATQSANLNEKSWDLQTLMSSENEFHKHLKNEVSDMYMAWDEADARINSQLEVLTSSLIAWRQLECGLSEFQQALGQDRGTLKGLEGALSTGQATPGEMAQNVKLVAKLLSEKVNVSQEQLTAVQDYLDPNHVLHIHKFTASNGSLSDSGISDGGTTSDGGLSERERRLGVLRRLAKQLESALAPGSEAMKSIAARMESAEVELKSLQNTCRDLIVRTAASHQNKKQQQELERQQLQQQQQQHKDAELLANGIKINQNGGLKTNGHIVMLENGNGIYDAANNKRNKRRPRRSISASSNQNNAAADMSQVNAAEIKSLMTANGDDGDDPSDDPLGKYEFDSSDDDEQTPKAKRGWAWRIARVAVPMQLALFTVYCAACMMQPNCCDNLNNFSMSFAPQLRYIRGPPPI